VKTPMIMTSIATTTKVYGRRSASLTIHMERFYLRMTHAGPTRSDVISLATGLYSGTESRLVAANPSCGCEAPDTDRRGWRRFREWDPGSCQELKMENSGPDSGHTGPA
jgi:hypothetical protein